MKKYKLIRIYPKSPELGTIMEFGKAWGDTEQWIKDNSKAAKEFWQLIEEDYKILDKKYILGQRCMGSLGLSWKIKSVRRLSDNQIFSVGDKVKYSGKKCEYKNFIIDNFTKIKLGILARNKDNTICELLNEIVKIKIPLFTTFDGKDIFENETFWYVTKKGLNLWSKTCNSLSGGWAVNANRIGDISFSTKRLAEEYRDNNKPIYSKNQILKTINKMQAVDLDLAGRYIKQELNL